MMLLLPNKNLGTWLHRFRAHSCVMNVVFMRLSIYKTGSTGFYVYNSVFSLLLGSNMTRAAETHSTHIQIYVCNSYYKYAPSQ